MCSLNKLCPINHTSTATRLYGTNSRAGTSGSCASFAVSTSEDGCNVCFQRFKVSPQGSNKWYAKVKAEGGKSSVKSMRCNGKSGSRTSDGYFVFNGLNTCSLSCRVQFTRGGSKSGRVKAC